MNILLVFLAHLLFATTFSVTKMALWYGSAYFLVTYRLIVGGLLLLGLYQLSNANWSFLKQKAFWKDTFLLSLCMAYIPYLGEYWAMNYLSSIKACLLYNLSPFVTALLCYYISQEQLSRRQIGGMIIGFLGSIPLLIESMPIHTILQNIHIPLVFPLPESILFMVMAIAAYGWILIQKAHLVHGYPILLLNGVSMLLGGFFAGIHTTIYSDYFLINVNPETIYLFLISGTALTLLSTAGHTLYSYVLSGYSATFISLSALTIPMFATFFGVAFLGESITGSFICSMLIVSVGLGFFYTDETRYQNGMV